MNCCLNWSLISCGELHCDSVKIKTMINSGLFFLRQSESLDWSDCFVGLLLSATHFRKSGHARLIRRCFKRFRAGVFSSLSPPPPPLPWTCPISSSLREVSTWRFRQQKHFCARRKRLHCRLRPNWLPIDYIYKRRILLKMFQFFMGPSELFSKPSRPTRFDNQFNNIIRIYTKLVEVLFNIEVRWSVYQ